MRILTRTALVPAVVLIAMTGLTACNSIKEERRSNELTTSQTTFAKLLRWGMFEEASRYLRGRDGEAIAVNLEGYDEVQVARYQVIKEGFSEDGAEAIVTAEITYYRQDTSVVREIRHEQVWWYDDEIQRWFIDGSLPEFR